MTVIFFYSFGCCCYAHTYNFFWNDSNRSLDRNEKKTRSMKLEGFAIVCCGDKIIPNILV